MKEFKLFILSCFAIICVALFGSVFTSCSNDDDLFLADDSQTGMVSSLAQDSVVGKTRSILDYNSVETSEGWSLNSNLDMGSNYGFKVYEKNGNYLQKVNLSMGAIITNGFGSSYYNEALPESPLYKRKKISHFWSIRPTKALSVTNCAYFGFNDINIDESNAPLSFPVKWNNSMLTIGSDNTQSNKRMLIFSFSNQCAYVQSYNVTQNNPSQINSAIPYTFAICGFSPSGNFQASSLFSLGRTMIGIKDQDGDGKKEVVYILTANALQLSAKSMLEDLGCSSSDIIMFDGHLSTGMIARNPSTGYQVNFQIDQRTIPHVIYVLRP